MSFYIPTFILCIQVGFVPNASQTYLHRILFFWPKSKSLGVSLEQPTTIVFYSSVRVLLR